MKLESIASYKRDSNITKILLFVTILVVILVNGYMVLQFKEQSNKVIVVDRENNALLATKRELTDAEIIAKMEDHVSDFYHLFFQFGYELEGPNSWEYRLDKALKLIDNSGIELYNTQANTGVYNKAVEEKWMMRANTISFEWDFSDGINGRVYGEQTLIFANGTTKKRKLDAVFSMNINVGIEHDNPHGYKIMNFRIVNDQELK